MARCGGDPVFAAQAEAERALDVYLVPACGGDARSSKIATKASSVYRLTRLLSQVRPSPGDLAILAAVTADLRSLLGS